MPVDLDRYHIQERFRRLVWQDEENGEKKRTLTPIDDYVSLAVNQATERFGQKSRKELLQAGRLVATRLGTYMIDIVRKPGDRTLAGHQAAQAFGFDGMISVDVARGTFMLNTLNPRKDLSRDPRVMALCQKVNGVMVRGTMLIKPPDAEPKQISLKDILGAVAPKDFTPQGLIKDALELEAKGELKPEREAKTEEETLREVVAGEWEEEARKTLSTLGYSDQEIEALVKLMRDKEVALILQGIKEGEKKDGGK